jgi:hypothetical protein
MPCLVEDRSYEADRRASKDANIISTLLKEKSNLEASLCAALTFMEALPHFRWSEFVGGTDWNEVGITSEQVESWWVNHKKKDAERRIREAEQKERDAEKARRSLAKQIRRETALSKLTEEDRIILGVK